MAIDKALRIGVGVVFPGCQSRPQWLAVSITDAAVLDLASKVHASEWLEIPARAWFRFKTALDAKFQRRLVSVDIERSALTNGNNGPIEGLRKTNLHLAPHARFIGNSLGNVLRARRLFESNQGAPTVGVAASLVATELLVRTAI